MKRDNKRELRAVVCSVVLLASWSAYANEHGDVRDRRIALGVKVGSSVATQSTEAPFGNNLEASHKTGLLVGAAVIIDMSKLGMLGQSIHLALQPEVLTVSKGTNIDFAGEKIGAYHLRYVEIPLLVRAAFSVTPEIAPYLTVGPGLAILVNAELENSRGDREGVGDGIRNFDFGIIAGAGMSVDLAAIGGALNLEARYDLGLLNINGTGMGGYVKNRGFAFMAGYQRRLF